jgi:prepilin-type N-terminal cleavage/methylation domain-containing protein
MLSFVHPPDRRPWRRGGFSLVEVLFAIGVVGVGLLGLFSVFVTGMRANAYGRNTAEATNHARQILEIIRSRGLAFKTPTMPPNAASGFNDGTARVALNASPPLQLAMMPDSAQYQRTITTRRASDEVNSHLYDLLEITITVHWEERGTPRSVSVTGLLKGGST